VLQDKAGGGGAGGAGTHHHTPHFNLTLRAYRGPMVRLLVDEFPAPPADVVVKEEEPQKEEQKQPPKEGSGDGATDENAAAEPAPPPPPPPAVLSPEARRRLPRYQLPDILEPTLESSGSAVSWSRASETKHTWVGAVEVEGDNARAVVRLTFDPFKVELWVVEEESGDGGASAAADAAPLAPPPTTRPSAIINGRSMFHVERTRREGPQPGDAEGLWEESFNGHADSKPRGPQAISLDLSFPGASHLYGLPERATALALRPTAASSPLEKPAAGSAYSEPYRLYNLDVFEYLDESPFGLYGSIPYLVAHRAEEEEKGKKGGGGGGNGGNGNGNGASPPQRLSTTVGAAWINAAEQYVDVSLGGAKDGGASAQWIAESGVLDLFLLAGPKPADVSRQLARVAGPTAMPQYFSLGYHQCRWNYKDEEDVTAVDAGFDAHAIPYDVLWLDIEHTDGKR
jgi:hypothetical protein